MSAFKTCIRHECVRRDAWFGVFICTSRKIWELNFLHLIKHN